MMILNIIILIKEICKIIIIVKSGRSIWDALIPLSRECAYSEIIFGDSRFFWLSFGPVFGLGVFCALNLHMPIFIALGSLLVPALKVFAVIFGLYIAGLLVWESVAVADMFDRGMLFAAGLFFLPFIFYPYLVLNEL